MRRIRNQESMCLLSYQLIYLFIKSNNSQLLCQLLKPFVISRMSLLIPNGLKCLFFAMIRPRLWPSPGLVLAITLSDASFSRKVGVKKIWNPPTL